MVDILLVPKGPVTISPVSRGTSRKALILEHMDQVLCGVWFFR